MPWTRDADGVRFHVAVSDHEHGVDLHLLGAGDLCFDVIAARVELGADFVGAQFGLDGAGVFEERRLSSPIGRMRTCSGASQSGKLPA